MSSNKGEGGTHVDEVTADVFEIEDKEALIDEMMNKYGQEILQLVYWYVNNKEVAEDLTQIYLLNVIVPLIPIKETQR
jgi:RNA polymerase sigma-70 factor (ECF subfamily)